MWRYTSPSGGGPPVHIHRAEDEFFYVLSGAFNFQLGDCIKSAPAGSFVFIPKDAVHTFQHIGPEPGVLLGVVTPGGFEELFQDLPGAEAETVKALLKKHHMDIVGPPLEAATPPAQLTSPGTAQPPAKVSRIAVLAPGCPPPSPTLDTFLQGLRDLGYVDGQTITIEWRYSEGRAERFPDLAAELARLKVDLIVAVSTPAALAAKHAASTIPIVMVYVADPVGTGLVTSLGRPGGNLTGISDMATDLSAKRLELLKEAVPTLSRVAVLWNSADPGMVLRFREIETAARVPAMYEFGVFAREGGLMAYGPQLTDTFQRGAYHVDRILKGAKPADLPVEQPMNFELVINLKTAEALGLTIPPHLLVLADRGDTDRDQRCARIW